MSAVLVNGKRIEFPDDWIVVAVGDMEPGDKRLVLGVSGLTNWETIDHRRSGCSVSCYPLVIRRDPKETP